MEAMQGVQQVQEVRRAKVSTRGLQQKLAENMRRWQQIENAIISTTAKAMEETTNPLLRMMMEIIQRDANNHHRVQQWIIDSLDTVTHISVRDITEIGQTLDRHVQIERDSVALAQESLEAIKDSNMLAQTYLLRYLVEDEKKHERLLADLDLIKRGMYPY